MTKRPSSTDVARRAGVSRTTVSFVLNGRRDQAIPEETWVRVQRAATELQYRHNKLARGLVHGRSGTFGVLVYDIRNSFHARIVYGIQEACLETGHSLLLMHMRRDPDADRRQVDLMLQHRVDGIVCVGGEGITAGRGSWVAEIQSAQVPCLLVDDRAYASELDCVATADVDGARAAVQHLIGLGHRRIAHLSAGDATSTGRDRAAGYRVALEEAGIAADESLIAGHSYLSDTESAARMLLDSAPLPTAVFAANDLLAVVFLREARARGLRVPEDIALVGYGDIEVASFLGLTTVAQEPEQMGQAAVQHLAHHLQELAHLPEEVLLPTHLVIRSSCGSAPGVGGDRQHAFRA